MSFLKTKQLVSLDHPSARFDTHDSNAILKKAARTLCNRIENEAIREYISDCLTRDDYRSLCNSNPPYRELTPSDAYLYRQCQAFFSKRRDLDLGEDRQSNADRKFREAECLCKQTNTIFRLRRSGSFVFPPRVESVLFTASRKISQILGDVPDLSMLKFRFGPGATTKRNKKDAHPRYKLGDALSCSENFIPIAGEFLAEFPRWVGLSEANEALILPIEVDSGRVSFVPKNWKTDRAIVVEPMLNTMFQAGVGDFLAARLSKFGLSIRDQTRNQNLARLGSINGALATLDLSSASDTISKELVADLLPLDWFTFLSFGRSVRVKLGDEEILLEKFSSMGNGFTFPLETLIFYSLAFACCEGRERSEVSCYGDDIIIPSHRFDLLCEVLRCTGFIPNEEKSFKDGPFRESCGKDYLLGTDIRPCYVKDKLSREALFVLHNFFHRRFDYEVCRILRHCIHPSIRIFGPDGYGDGHLLSDYRGEPHKRNLGWCGYTFETYVSRKRQSFMPSRSDYVLPSYTIYAAHQFRDETMLRPWWFLRLASDNSLVYRRGALGVTLPGTKGFKRITVYTLDS